MAEQLEFYFPKTKSKHMAMPTTGKKYPSKGGTVRYGVQASMNGSMSLPKYVKEEEFYDYGFGVDSVVRKYPQKFLDAFYDFDSNPTADTQDDETVAIAYQAWYQKQAENEVLNAEVSVGEKQITNRKDYDIDNEVSGFSNMEVGDIDLEDYEDEITASVEDEVIEAIRESVDDAMPISDGDSVSSYVNVDTELEITVPISGDIDYDWTANENYDENEDEWNAETEPEVFGGSNYAVKMIKNAQNHLKMVREAESFEAPYGGIGSLFGIGGDTEIGGFSTSELTGSSAIHGDFDSASLNYSGHQNLQVRAETEKVCKFEGCGDMYSPEWYSDDYCTTACANDMIICGKNKPFTYDLKSVSDTLAGQMRTNDSWNDGAYGDFCQSLTEDVDGMEMCNDCDYQQVDYGAEMDELSEDTSIIRNRVGDMVGMVELDENDEDIEKVDIDIIDDDGEMAYEGTLGAETFESQGTNTKMILGITALAVGLGLWKGKEIMSISEKITESIKNMRK